MRKSMVNKVWIPAFLLVALIAGCGDPDKNGAGTPGPLTPPTVTAVTPPNGSTLVCPNTAIITATFSKAMNAATINTSTFTVSVGGANVAGNVTYVSATNVATFTPTVALPASTLVTVTITTGASDTFGSHLDAPGFTWSFTTSAVCPPPPPPPSPLGAACSFGILASSTVTNTLATNVAGDVGLWPGTAIVGFPPGTLSAGGMIHDTDSAAMAAQGALTTAYNFFGTQAGGTFGNGAGTGTVLPGDIGGLPAPFPPGVYRTTSASPSLGITGNLTLDGGGNPNAVWIFQIGSTLTTAANNSHIFLQNGASSHNVFWQVSTSAILGTNTVFQGTIMTGSGSVTLNHLATLNGRALSQNGAVTMDDNNVVVPPCP